MNFDFEDPKETSQITEACHEMLKDFGGVLHHIFFSHGVINFMGGLDAVLHEYKHWHEEYDKKTHTGAYVDRSDEYGKVSKVNVRATM